MRTITQNATRKFLNFENFKSKNTKVEAYNNESRLFLFGNLIARIENDRLYINNAGWFTNTTKERLNALPGVNIFQKSFKWYLNGEEWDGKEKFICNV